MVTSHRVVFAWLESRTQKHVKKSRRYKSHPHTPNHPTRSQGWCQCIGQITNDVTALAHRFHLHWLTIFTALAKSPDTLSLSLGYVKLGRITVNNILSINILDSHVLCFGSSSRCCTFHQGKRDASTSMMSWSEAMAISTTWTWSMPQYGRNLFEQCKQSLPRL